MLMMGLCLNAQDIDVVFLNQRFKNGFPARVVIGRDWQHLRIINVLNFGQVYFFQPLVFRREVKNIQQFFFLNA